MGVAALGASVVSKTPTPFVPVLRCHPVLLGSEVLDGTPPLHESGGDEVPKKTPKCTPGWTQNTPGAPPTARYSAPERVTDDFTYYHIDRNPWAKFVNLWPRELLSKDFAPISRHLCTDTHRLLLVPGYMSMNFVRSLFLTLSLHPYRPPLDIPFIELLHLEDTIGFHARSEAIITELLGGAYVNIDVRSLLRRADNELFSSVELHEGRRKDFFTVGPDRRDLPCILFDGFAIDLLKDKESSNEEFKPAQRMASTSKHVNLKLTKTNSWKWWKKKRKIGIRKIN
ncbi:unnamed protein product [Heligmosomoides polygyrus]|uniref:UDENN domain-containing protein n=1 Tax=Heligmosomoides polygyrus TaxID=6339 RepID=A0A183GLY4_HELPZ|nr:unnamed protein product [Heligmosomoides polygyrus]